MQAFAQAFPGSNDMLDNLRANYNMWKEAEAQQQACDVTEAA